MRLAAGSSSQVVQSAVGLHICVFNDGRIVMARKELAGYQVSLHFGGGSPSIHTILYDENNTEVGQIMLEDLERLPHFLFGLDMMRECDLVEWDEDAEALRFPMQFVGED
jgi:hypothetical protein